MGCSHSSRMPFTSVKVAPSPSVKFSDLSFKFPQLIEPPRDYIIEFVNLHKFANLHYTKWHNIDDLDSIIKLINSIDIHKDQYCYITQSLHSFYYKLFYDKFHSGQFTKELFAIMLSIHHFRIQDHNCLLYESRYCTPIDQVVYTYLCSYKNTPMSSSRSVSMSMSMSGNRKAPSTPRNTSRNIVIACLTDLKNTIPKTYNIHCEKMLSDPDYCYYVITYTDFITIVDEIYPLIEYAKLSKLINSNYKFNWTL